MRKRRSTDAPPGFLSALLRRPVAFAAFCYLVLLVVACVAAPVVALHDPQAQDLLTTLSGPSWSHLAGTDDLGRDVFSRLLFGGRITLLAAAEAVGTFVIVGVPAGLAAGFVGGRTDRAIMWVTDIVLSLPVIIILLVVAAVFTGNLPLMITLGVVSSPGIIRVVRASTIAVKSELYVKAAEVVGLRRALIVRRHILPQVLGPLLVQVTVFAAAAVAIEASLGFLDLDVQPPAPSWGSMVSEGATFIDQQPWLIIPSGGIIAITVIALGLVGDAIRDISASRTTSTPVQRSPGASVQRPTITLLPTDPVPDRIVSGGEDTLLSVRNLTVAFPGAGGDLTVVDRVSLDVRRGDSLGIVGESGCGKTMMALALLGLLPSGGRIAGGSVRLQGRELVGLKPNVHAKLRGTQIGLISQEPMVALDPVFTVGSQLREVVRTHRAISRKAADDEALQLLSQVRLANPRAVADRYAHELSGGMAQRVCIALALAGRPQLLIADEPTTALDVTVQAEILDLLHALREDSGMAIMLVTHDWGVVADFCERVAVMYAGQFVEMASSDEIFASPRHPYTAGLLAANPHLAAHGPLPSIPGTVPPPGEWPAGCRFAARCRYATDDCSVSAVAARIEGPGRMTRCLYPERISRRAANDS